ncbi:hypothetical protein [Martelella mediterranea]|uniref:DNA-binding transcriptional repressor CapW winged helix-turn-helix domain-containing protein n=1 Tax=Martelella mediterranea TaxID=293089 RepID=A0A4R3NKD0_9HYPH|nr:hypothetical protein [Martelella mediterranea]TCT34627.1 hypothetical protein EDC90_103321 [Martelella mediterranea]
MTTFFQTMRLLWIDAAVQSEQALLRRADICQTFDISISQAALDLRQFQTAFPGRLEYDRSAKGYRAAAQSMPSFPECEPATIRTSTASIAIAKKRLDRAKGGAA